MTFRRIDITTHEQLIERSTEVLCSAVASGVAVQLIVPTHQWGQQRKLQLMHAVPCGVEVLTHAQWVSTLWDVNGDGSALVDSATRQMLLGPLVNKGMDVKASQGLVREFAQLAEELAAPGLQIPQGLSEAEQRVLGIVEQYLQTVTEKGLTEIAQAEHALLQCNFANSCFVFEYPDETRVHARRFAQQLASSAQVTELCQKLQEDAAQDAGESELRRLASALFTGESGLEAQGQVLLAEAHGTHAVGELCAKLAQRFMQQGARPQDIAFVFRDAADSYPHIQDALAHAGIPFQCAFSVPLHTTSFGTALLELARYAEAPEADDGYYDLASFIVSPYSGVEPCDARALQGRWRGKSGATAQERQHDMQHAFNGHAAAKLWHTRLDAFNELAQADFKQRVYTMFENGRRAGLDSNRLLDDRAAANAALDYLERCEQLGLQPNMEELAAVKVGLQRAMGNAGERLRLLDTSQLALEQVPYILFGGLDAGHFPMNGRVGPFDLLRQKLGLQKPSDAADKQRMLLLDLLNAAQKGFAAFRCCHNAEGAENCQSALWDELTMPYRTAEDADAPIHAIPKALERAGCAVRLSEAEGFAAASQQTRGEVAITRGKLEDELAMQTLLAGNKGDELVFSPTALEDYYRCPYRWFMSRRVGYRQLDYAFDQAQQGNLVHDTLERFYIKLHEAGHARVTPENLDAALELAEGAFDEQLARDVRRGTLTLQTEQDRLICQELCAQVRGIVSRDATFLPGFAPTHLELKLGEKQDNLLEYAGVRVRGKVDRIDVDAQGNAVIIDYKLSKLGTGYGFEEGRELPTRIQTDIYATLVQRHFRNIGEELNVVGSVYRSYSSNVLRGVYSEGIDWGPNEKAQLKHDVLPRVDMPVSYGEYLQRVEQAVCDCIEQLRAGVIEPAPIAKGVCQYCKALGFCPKSEGV